MDRITFGALLGREAGGAFSLSESLVDSLFAHFSLLCQWNRKLNLTSIRREEEIVLRHYCESLFLAGLLVPPPTTLVDIGSGAGFPGAVIALALPAVSVTLVESHQRKAVFLRESCRHLLNVRVVSVRAESVPDRFECLTSRGVSGADLAPLVPRLSSRFALLVGEESLPEYSDARVVRLPWGDRRFAVLGDVPRGTSSL
jgi:16S rRNA (guanine527-N7)-methyltransferase